MLYILKEDEEISPDRISEMTNKFEAIATKIADAILKADITPQETVSIGYLIMQWALFNIELNEEDERLFFKQAEKEYFKYKIIKEKHNGI